MFEGANLVADSESREKAKRSLVTVSVSLFLLAALDFRSEELDLFGLRLGISQNRIIIIGRLVAAYLLIRYALYVGLDYIDSIQEKSSKANEAWEKASREGFPEEPEPEGYYGPEPESWEIDHIKESLKRKNENLVLRDRAVSARNVTGSVLNTIIPLIFGISAVTHPKLLRYVIDCLQ